MHGGARRDNDRRLGYSSVMPLRVAVILPCRNEEAAIAGTIASFRKALPGADIHVYDNASTDRTAEVAREAGAIVGREPMPGKGNVVRRMFADVEADVYVMADGDDTYDAAVVPDMIERLSRDNLDMVVGRRRGEGEALYRAGHRFGNRMLTGAVGLLFGDRFADVLSGYRVMSRRFVKSFPALATGFEIETELSVHALELRMPVAEIDCAYRARPAGSSSKLKTYRDGFRILWTIMILFKEVRPFEFFGLIALALGALSLGFAAPVILTFVETGLVPRFPTAILSTGIMLLAFLSLTCGLVLHSLSRARIEAKRMSYLAIPGVDRS